MGKTLTTLFSAFRNEDLCNLYFSVQRPNIDICSSYYQVNEKMLIKSLLGLKSNSCGREIAPLLSGYKSIVPEKNPSFFVSRSTNIEMRIFRDLLWGISHWKNRHLKKWIEKENPDVIFTIMHDMISAISSVKWVAKKYQLPVVLFVTDDYYNDSKKSKNLITKIFYFYKKKENIKLAKYCKSLVGCSKKITTYFSNIFNINRGGYCILRLVANIYNCL